MDLWFEAGKIIGAVFIGIVGTVGAKRFLPSSEESMAAELKLMREAQHSQGEHLNDLKLGQASDRSRSKETDAAMIRELQTMNATLIRLIEIVSRRSV